MVVMCGNIYNKSEHIVVQMCSLGIALAMSGILASTLLFRTAEEIWHKFYFDES